MNNISVTNPWLAFLAIPLLAVVVAFFFHIPKKKRLFKKNVISLVLHCVITVTLTLAFMDIRFLYTSKETELYVIADVSDSEQEGAEKMDELIKEVINKAGPTTKVGVVAYAKDAKVVTPIGASFSGISSVYEDTSFIKSASNLENALRYTSSLYKDETVRRMLIISDGAETDGDAMNALEEVLDKDITIDCIYLREEKENEVAITDLKYIEKGFLGREQDLKVFVRSRAEAQLAIKLEQDGVLYEKRDIQVNGGLNTINFTLPSDKVGSFEYKVTLEARQGTEFNDKFADNNTMTFKQEITDEFKLLLIDGSKSDKYNLQGMGLFTDNTIIDEYQYTQTNLPYKLEKLVEYDEIILSDVTVNTIPHYKDFLLNLRTCVSVYGKTLMNFGTVINGSNDSSIGLFNDMLPIQFHTDGKKAVVLNIDVSGSMETDSRITKARDGAKQCLEVLNEDDYVGIVTFSDNAEIIQPLTTVKNKANIRANINTIESQGGTQMGPGLTKSNELLKNVSFEYKHVITLSDGEPFETDDELEDQVERMAKNNIVCSFINISNKSGETLLTKLTKAGNGRYYYVKTSNELTKIMIQSVSENISDTIINKSSPVAVNESKKNDQTLEGITVTEDTFPNVGGFNFCRIKSEANTVLTTQYVEKDSNGENNFPITVPLYAYWSYGKGNVSCFTSSVGTNGWTTTFRNTENGKRFFQNAFNTLLPENGSKEQIQLEYETRGYTTDIHVTANDGDTTADVKLELTDSAGNKVTKTLFYDGNVYSATFDTALLGKYNAHVAYTHTVMYENGQLYPELLGEIDYPVYFDFSSEYALFNNDDGSVLYGLSEANGNTTIGEVDYGTLENEIEFRSYRSTMMWFLFATLGIFLADVFVRKGEPKKKKTEYTVGGNKA